MKKIISLFLVLILSFNPVLTRADMLVTSLQLPVPGVMVNPSETFSPALLRGLVVHPDKPLQFDFIVDHGENQLNGEALTAESQSLVNYFLASLTVAQKDLWVNLSPVEHDRIIPDALIKTELGRDLLAQDYMLKQVAASLIYPENGLGKMFWKKVYDEAYQKFGVTEIPVDVFNKVWIVPQTASVYEKGNAAYVVNAHLKVMLEADYIAKGLKGDTAQSASESKPVDDLTKQVLRQVIVPAIEKEVNEGRNFAKVRQIVYSMVLAQWYQDVLKESVLNKAYAGKGKVAGIDLSDPKNKEIIYQQYMAAYKKGVFNYIKEENDRLTNEPLPKKYFSGGFQESRIDRTSAKLPTPAENVEFSELKVNIGVGSSAAENTVLETPKILSHEEWSGFDVSVGILTKLKACWPDGVFNKEAAVKFLTEQSVQVDAEADLYPIQGAWPVLKAFALLNKNEKKELLDLIQEMYKDQRPPVLMEGMLLISRVYDGSWAGKNTPHLIGRRIYLLAAEIHHWAGGLGPVMKFLGKLLKELGLEPCYIAPKYQLRRDKGNPNGDPLDYKDLGFTVLEENVDEFDIQIPDMKNENESMDEYLKKPKKTIHVHVSRGVDENGVEVYMFQDILPDGSSYYTKMLYNYGGKGKLTRIEGGKEITEEIDVNPVTKEESMAFINIASAELLKRLETKRFKEKGADWKSAIVHTNDGQLAPMQAVTMSRFGKSKVIRDIIWSFTTHTYYNRGANKDSRQFWNTSVSDYIKIVIQHMWGILPRYINAFRAEDGDNIDHTNGGLNLAKNAFSVSNNAADDLRAKTKHVKLRAATNGSAPDEMARDFHHQLEILGADLQDPTWENIKDAKRGAKEAFNALGVISSTGAKVDVNVDAKTVGTTVRAVVEKVSRDTAFTRRNILFNIQKGGNVVLFLYDQGKVSDDIVRFYTELEQEIFKLKADPKTQGQYPGRFYFVKAFTPQQKIAALSMFDLDVKISFLRSETNGTTEADALANAALQLGPSYGGRGEGAITAQAIRLDVDKPGQGNLLLGDNEGECRNAFEVFYSLQPDQLAKNQLTSYKLGQSLMLAVRTASVNAGAYESAIVQQEREQALNRRVIAQIVNDLKTNPGAVPGILSFGRNNQTKPFVFHILDVGERAANKDGYSNGLRGFIAEARALQSEYGEDSIYGDYESGAFGEYLTGIFGNLKSDNLIRKLYEKFRPVKAKNTDTNRRNYFWFLNFIEQLQTEIDRAFPEIGLNREQAVFILKHIGQQFNWTDAEGKEVAKNGKGLRPFVRAYDIVRRHRPDVLAADNKSNGKQRIVKYLRDMLDESTILSPLKTELLPLFDEIELLDAEQVDEKVTLLNQIMSRVSNYVDALTRHEVLIGHEIIPPEKVETPDSDEFVQAILADNTEVTKTGGIDVRNIQVNRQGQLQ
ncbi:MAG: glycogen/starch synthase, partial [Candidatus Omnitrophica bacterium]|nr:glycogen/starch synthase [Candidatus Omnitrophota bacterium]